MIRHFFYGTLCHPPLLKAVVGRLPELRPARIAGFSARSARHDGHELGFPILVPSEGDSAPGVVCDLSPDEAERIGWYEAGFRIEEREITTDQGEELARVWLPEPGHWDAGASWTLVDWLPHWGALKTEAAADFIREARQIGPVAANARYHSILVRAHSSLQARAEPMPETLRRKHRPDDVKIYSQRLGYNHFFSVEDYRLRHEMFRGGMSEPLERAVFVSGDAAVVLPYDPRRDRVLLIEQFRAGPLARGEPNPWQIEAIAGRIDPGETPVETARREAVEEAGVTLGRLIEGPRFYPSPGAKSEFIFCYVGITDLPDGAGRPGGLAEEGEDIRPHLVSFDQLMEMVASGEVGNAPLVILALWLDRIRESLRAKG